MTQSILSPRRGVRILLATLLLVLPSCGYPLQSQLAGTKWEADPTEDENPGRGNVLLAVGFSHEGEISILDSRGAVYSKLSFVDAQTIRFTDRDGTPSVRVAIQGDHLTLTYPDNRTHRFRRAK
jgi:hypothetical protein